jgi:hypothetical protein
MKCNHSFHQKNPDFKCHVNNKYEEGVYLAQCWIKTKHNVTMPQTKRNWTLQLAWKLAPETLFCLLYLSCCMSHHIMTDLLSIWLYNTTAASHTHIHTHTHTHTHTQRLQHEYSFKDQSTEQGGSSGSVFHMYLEVPVSNPDHGPNYPDISHTLWHSNKANDKEYLKIGHNNFLPHPLQFNNH